MDALSRAFAESERMYAGAVASVKSSPSGSMLASSPGGFLGAGIPNLSRAREQYAHNSGWVYVAVRAICFRVAAQDCYVARQVERRDPMTQKTPMRWKALGDNLEVLTKHPLLECLHSPNPLMTKSPLLMSTVGSLLLTGRSYWWLTADSEGKPEIWPLPSSWVRPKDLMRSGWEVKTIWGQEFSLPADEIAPFVLPDPGDPFGSISPLQSQSAAITADEAIQASQWRSFENGIHPGLAIRVGSLEGGLPGEGQDVPVLSKEQRREVRDAVLALYRGAVNYHEPLILDGLIKGIDRITSQPAEMDYLNSGKATKSRILQAFGVNAIIAGEIENANKASSTVAETVFCDSAVNPVIQLLSEGLTRSVAPRFALPGEKLVCFIDPAVPKDAEHTLNLWEAGIRMGAVSVNEYRVQMLGLSPVDADRQRCIHNQQFGDTIASQEPDKVGGGYASHPDAVSEVHLALGGA